ncbi:MAG: NAD(P)-dependent oxidoreductase [Haloarculaceae archaeon]
MTHDTPTCLLCGDPQQPSEYMYENAAVLAERGIEVRTMDWQAERSAAEFREVTMEMESRGPADYDDSAIRANIDGVNYLVVHKAPVSRGLLDVAEGLEVVGCARGGTENVDAEAAAERGVRVLHAPGRNANAVADFALATMLAHHRRVPYFDRTTSAGGWELEFDPERLPRDLTSLAVGVVGFGNVGRKVARRLGGFDADVLVHDPYVDDDAVRETDATPLPLEGLLERADVVTLHVRLSEETRDMIGTEELGLMKESAFVVNTARGGLIDEDALVEALDAGEVAGAALDVFETEPLPGGHPLLDREDVTLSPHTAGSTRDAVSNGSKLVVEGLLSIIDGEEPSHEVT